MIRSRRGSLEVSTWVIAAATSRVDRGDLLVHRLGDGAVGGVALAPERSSQTCIASRALRSST